MMILDAKKADVHAEKFIWGAWPIEMYTQALFSSKSSRKIAELAALGAGKAQIWGSDGTTQLSLHGQLKL